MKKPSPDDIVIPEDLLKRFTVQYRIPEGVIEDVVKIMNVIRRIAAAASSGEPVKALHEMRMEGGLHLETKVHSNKVRGLLYNFCEANLVDHLRQALVALLDENLKDTGKDGLVLYVLQKLGEWSFYGEIEKKWDAVLNYSLAAGSIDIVDHLERSEISAKIGTIRTPQNACAKRLFDIRLKIACTEKHWETFAHYSSPHSYDNKTEQFLRFTRVTTAFATILKEMAPEELAEKYHKCVKTGDDEQIFLGMLALQNMVSRSLQEAEVVA